MRLRVLAITSIIAPLAALAAACSSTPADDTCAFIADTNNCYVQLARAIDDCLTDVTETSVNQGTLSADGKSCTYPSGRSITFAGDARTYKAGSTPVEFTVTLNGKTCVHVVDNGPTGGDTTLTGPGGTSLVATSSNGDEAITCPDGTTHRLSGQKIFTGGCGPNVDLSNVPAVETANPGITVSGGLPAQKKQDYNCSDATPATP